MAFARLRWNKSFTVLAQSKRFLIAITLGSITGTIAGGLLMGIVPNLVLIPLHVLLLLLSTVNPGTTIKQLSSRQGTS